MRALLEAGFKLFIHLDIIYSGFHLCCCHFPSGRLTQTYLLWTWKMAFSAISWTLSPVRMGGLLRYIIMSSIGEMEKRVEGLTDEINDIFHATALNLSALGVQL